MIEIERKFLVLSDDFKQQSNRSRQIVQGYLNSNPKRSVRIRIQDNLAFLTVKGIGNESGMSRFEWEKPISVVDATHLLALCEEGVIEKIRYEIPLDGHVFEVDEFSGDNDGLIIAEIELKSEDEMFQKPDWLGKEVTNDRRYYNSELSINPFKTWK